MTRIGFYTSFIVGVSCLTFSAQAADPDSTLATIVMLRNRMVSIYKPHQQSCSEQKTDCEKAQDELSAIQLVDREIDELRTRR